MITPYTIGVLVALALAAWCFVELLVEIDERSHDRKQARLAEAQERSRAAREREQLARKVWL